MSSAWPLCPSIDVKEISFLGHDIRVHYLAAPAFRLVEIRASLTEYGTAFASGELNPSPTGAYVCRNRRPYPEQPVTWAYHSEHAHAVAVDVNYDSNPLRTDGVLLTDFDKYGDGCDWLACWLTPPEGLNVLFRWGGGWTTDLQQACVNLRHNGQKIRTGTVDPMHFELVLSPDECRAFNWDRAIKEAEAMKAEIEQAAEFVKILRAKLKPGADSATVRGAAERTAEAVLEVEKR